LLEDEELQWWKASAVDNYDINQKLLRVGCRPLKRKLIRCKQQAIQEGTKVNCIKLESHYKNCSELLKYVQASYNKQVTSLE